ncbi:cell growth regulator with EF hand domain protein 1 [Gouania willdenowi]|uniref:EF-hand domain-containing protein n=1 Tax=Gouania willdenowi TaxID=441366 RepID=A0A8C5GVZ3_GOUWI|nr:cell growth regulator with EF hand domain protein 1 [Gouania willdenowi]
MQTGEFTKSHLDRLLSCALLVFLLINLCLAAPERFQRHEPVDTPPSAQLANPFDSGEEERRLLQSYIKSSLKNSSGEPEIHTREQEVFFLLRLYDYDRSGFLDGLEMMKLLSDYNSYHSPNAQTSEQVVSMVDSLLQSQDVNEDGLLTPSELLSPSLSHSEDSNASKHEREEKIGAVASNVNAGASEPLEDGGTQEGAQLQDEEQPQKETKAVGNEEEEKAIANTDHHKGKETPAEEQQPVQRIPVHQGQPEI